MTFAQVSLDTVDETFNVKDDDVLRGVDASTQRSLNGPRVTELVQLLVPE